MSNLEAGSETSNDLWHVQLPTGEVRQWSLDQLDAAFQADVINEWTHVLQDGSTEWMKLGELLGLDTAAPPAAEAPVAAMAVSPTPAPVSMAPASLPPASVALYSVRPVVSDIGDDLDLDAMAMRPKKRGLFFGVAAAVLLIGGIGFAATHLGGSPPAVQVSATSPALPPVVEVPPSPQAAPAPAPGALAAAVAAAALPAPGDTTTTSATSRLTESQRKALADADKSRDAARRSRVASTPARAPRTVSKPVFHKGGNKYDPLNSAL